MQMIRNRFYLVLGILFLVLLFSGNAIKSQSYNYENLITRIQEERRSTGITGVAQMDNWVASQLPDGSWSDLNYGTLDAGSATSTGDNHLLRLWNFAAVVSKTDHSKYNDNAYKLAIKNGLNYWYNSNTVDPNWWFNKIYFPQKLGEILLFMREFSGYIPQTASTGIDEPEVISLFQPIEINDITLYGSGANAIDIARHYIYRGILQEDGTLLENTRNYIELILDENIRADKVYQDHGPQIQIASYGWVFCDGFVRLAYFLSDSPAAFDLGSSGVSNVLDFIRETQISSIRGNSWDFSVMGRAVSRENALNVNLNYLTKIAESIDTPNAQTYNDALDRINGGRPKDYNIREFNKHYWNSDYIQHARSGYLFTVRNVSTRTVEAESGNGENLKANFFSYGANYISTQGDEYKNIMPVWDWAMIPGTTFPHTTTFPSRPDWGVNYGNTSFVGGVSDGTYGASVLDLNEAGITGKKSWFFFEDEMVCLGAGLTDNSGNNVRTTINQCWMETASNILENGASNETTQSVSSSTYSNSNLKYIRHRDIAYYFPDQGDVRYTMKAQTGRWSDINASGSSATESGYVFKLWMDHGTNPQSASYSYVVVPEIGNASEAQAYNLENIEIIENTSSVQAVYNNSLNVLQIIFHEPGTLVHGETSITVNRACALMVRDDSYVTVADPSQINAVVAIEIDVNGTLYDEYLSLPTSDGMDGSSVTTDFGIAPPTDIDEKEGNLKILVYPNPTKGLAWLKVDHKGISSFSLCNAKGKKLLEDTFSGTTEINLNSYPNGIYFLSVKSGEESSTQKLIKE